MIHELQMGITAFLNQTAGAADSISTVQALREAYDISGAESASEAALSISGKPLTPVFFMGAICGIIALLIYSKFKKEGAEKFDERQLFLRGNAFKHAFFTILIYCCIYSFLITVTGRPFMQDGVSTLLGALLGIGVVAVESILKEAFFSVGDNTKKRSKYYILLLLAVITMNVFGSINNGGINIVENGMLSMQCVHLANALLFTCVLAALVWKLYIAKPEEE